MKSVLFLFLIFIVSSSCAKNCKCEDELRFVVDYYEENLPGFIDNVNEDNLNEYNQFKKRLFKQSKGYCNDEDLCFKTLLVYVEFFKDNHSSIYKNKTIVKIVSKSDPELST